MLHVPVYFHPAKCKVFCQLLFPASLDRDPPKSIISFLGTVTSQSLSRGRLTSSLSQMACPLAPHFCHPLLIPKPPYNTAGHPHTELTCSLQLASHLAATLVEVDIRPLPPYCTRAWPTLSGNLTPVSALKTAGHRFQSGLTPASEMTHWPLLPGSNSFSPFLSLSPLNKVLLCSSRLILN